MYVQVRGQTTVLAGLEPYLSEPTKVSTISRISMMCHSLGSRGDQSGYVEMLKRRHKLFFEQKGKSSLVGPTDLSSRDLSARTRVCMITG